MTSTRSFTATRRTSGVTKASHEGEDEDESEEVPSTVRRRLTFTRQEEREQDRQLARAGWDLESQATAILPKTVQREGLGIAKVADGRWLYQLEA